MKTAPDSNPQSTPTLDRSIRFGTHLFVNPEDSAELLRDRLEVLDRAGFSLIRLFLPWSQLEPQPGKMKWSPFTEIFDEAQARQMKIVVTLMSVSPPGWMKMTHGLQDVADLDHRPFFEKSLEHVRTVVEKFRDHPALDSWILWNEPCREIRQNSPDTWKAFQKYLETSYKGDIDAYNACHFQPAASFGEIQPPASTAYETGFSSHRDKVEWLDFTVENLQDKLESIAIEVRRLDTEHPIHVNPHRVSQCLANLGQSLWREAETVDFMGCSAHPAWHSVRFPRTRYGDSIAMFSDLARSCTRAKDGYFWVTELQGGTTLMSAFQPLAATPAEARLWLWQCIGSGARAVVYWCANARTDGYEAGEWDLLDESGKAADRLQEITHTIEKMKPHLDDLEQAKLPVADVGILVSDESQTLDLVEGTDDCPKNPRNTQKGSDAACGAYLIAADLSLEAAFFNPARLKETALESLPKILIIPNLSVLDEKTIEFLKTATESGCLVISDGFFAWKDRFGRLSLPLRPLSAKLWGARCSGYESLSSFSLSNESLDYPKGWFARSLFEIEGAEVLGSWEDGRPYCLKNKLGNGSCIRIGSQFFQHYFLKAGAGAREEFSQWIRPFLPARPRLENPGPRLRLRRLRKEGGGEIGILINSSPELRVARVQGQDGKTTVVEVPSQDAVVLQLS